jgi:hypothetical protein
MEATERSPHFKHHVTRRPFQLDYLLLATAFAVGLAGRALSGWHVPLWFDETYSGVIATQPTIALWFSWCLNELTGPVYYGLLWICAHLLGGSDFALRLPSILASVIVAPIVAWRGHPDREVRWLWAVFIALWAPLFEFATSARPYAFLFLLSTIQAMLFLSSMRRQTLHRMMAWSAVSTLAILTHYHALIPTALQAVAYLATRTRSLPRLWPAGLLFVPVLMWMPIHLPFVLAVTGPNSSWYSLMGWHVIPIVPALLLGMSPVGADLLLAFMLILSLACLKRETGPRDDREAGADYALMVCTTVGLLLVFAMAMIRPSFTPRYLTPLLPGVIFAVAFWVRWVARSYPFAKSGSALFLLLFAAQGISGEVRDSGHGVRDVFSFEKATDWLMQQRVSDFVFFWDSPTARYSEPGRLAEVANFAARRAGHPFTVVEVHPSARGDASAYLVNVGNKKPGRAILWMYDRGVNGTLANDQPPHIEKIDPRWVCHDFGGGTFGVLTCIRKFD